MFSSLSTASGRSNSHKNSGFEMGQRRFENNQKEREKPRVFLLPWRHLRNTFFLLLAYSLTFVSTHFSQSQAHPLDELQISIRKKESGLSFRISVSKKLIPEGVDSMAFLRQEIAKIEISEDGEICQFNNDFIETREESSLEIVAAEQSLNCMGNYNLLKITKKSDLNRRASITAIWGDNWTSEALEMEASEVVIRPYEKQTRFFKFVLLGTNHLFTGVDHLLFLLTLLITAAYMRTSRVKALKTVLLEITLFTFAHGLSIIVAVSSRFPIPVHFIEHAIAGTVIFSGLCLTESGFFSMKKLIPLIIPFGLIHGLGFADVMKNMGLELRCDWVELLGFNLGIELGQLIVGVFVVGVMYPWLKFITTRKARTVFATIVVAAGFYMLIKLNTF